MKRGIVILISFFSISFLILFYNNTKDYCFLNFDCEWKITNCCSEDAGAKWECVNKKNFIEPECPKYVICPKILSPKPNLSCRCERGKCVIR